MEDRPHEERGRRQGCRLDPEHEIGRHFLDQSDSRGWHTSSGTAAMNVPGLLLSCGLSFVFLCLVFRPLELAFPARRGQRFLRPAWWTDLGFFTGQYLLWNGLIFWLLSNSGGCLTGAVPTGFRAAVASQRWWA